jgi:hypothetical protein
LVSYGQNEKKEAEGYSVVAMSTGGSRPGSAILFSFKINEYTTEEDITKFSVLLTEKGPAALDKALEGENKGTLTPGGGGSVEIAVARKRQEGPNTFITIVTARPLPFTELYGGGRFADYPFGFVQVKLDSKGKGTGQIVAASSLRFDKKDNRWGIESYGNQNIQTLSIRSQK